MLQPRLKPQEQLDLSRLIYSEEVLTEQECLKLRSWAEHEHNGLKAAVNEFPEHWQISYSTTQFPVDHEITTRLASTWQRIQEFYEFDLEFIETYEIKQYKSGDYITDHIDQFYNLEKERKLTMIVQLSASDEYTGGDLVLFKKHAISRTQGSVTVFPSTWFHAVTEITQGTRWSLNNWAWGAHWR